LRGGRHDDIDDRTALHEPAGQRGCFVRRNSAAYTEQQAPAGHAPPIVIERRHVIDGTPPLASEPFEFIPVVVSFRTRFVFQHAQDRSPDRKRLAHRNRRRSGDKMTVDLGTISTSEVSQMQLTRFFGQLRMFT
jgi:hypothetical protein